MWKKNYNWIQNAFWYTLKPTVDFSIWTDIFEFHWLYEIWHLHDDNSATTLELKELCFNWHFKRELFCFDKQTHIQSSTVAGFIRNFVEKVCALCASSYLVSFFSGNSSAIWNCRFCQMFYSTSFHQTRYNWLNTMIFLLS